MNTEAITQDYTRHTLAPAGVRSAANSVTTLVPHTDTTIAGRFSLLDRGPIGIEARPGLVVTVHRGSLHAVGDVGAIRRHATGGERITATRAGVLSLASDDRAELEVAWA